MTRAKNRRAAIVGRLIGSGVEVGLMTWAAFETEGVLRWSLVALVLFIIGGWAAVTAAKAEDAS